MKHYSSEEWSAYIRDQLLAKDQREYEDHLYGCDACLQLYTDGLTSVELDLAKVASMTSDLNEAYIEQIIGRIESQKQPLQMQYTPSRLIALYRKPVFQYALAAAITIILMATGILQGLTNGNEQQLDKKQTLDASYADQWMHKTVAMLDTIQLKAKLIEKRGVNHE